MASGSPPKLTADASPISGLAAPERRGLRALLSRLRGARPAPRAGDAVRQVIEAYRVGSEDAVRPLLADLVMPPARPADLLRKAANVALETGDRASATGLAPMALALDPSKAMLRWCCLIESRAGLLQGPAQRLADAGMGAPREGPDAQELRELVGYARLRRQPLQLPAAVAPTAAGKLSRVLFWRADGADAGTKRFAAALEQTGFPIVAAQPVATVQAADNAAAQQTPDAAAQGKAAVVGGAVLSVMPPDMGIEMQAKAIEAFAAQHRLHLIVSDGDLQCALPALMAARRAGLGLVAWFARPLASPPAYARDERGRLLHNLAIQVAQQADAVLVAGEEVLMSLELAGVPLHRMLRLDTEHPDIAGAALKCLLQTRFADLQALAATASKAARRADLEIDADLPADDGVNWQPFLLEKGRSIMLRATVGPGQLLRLALDARAPGPERPKGVLADIRYLDDQGRPLPAPYPDCSASAKRPAYFYVPVQPEAVSGGFRKRLTVPEGADRVEVTYTLFDRGDGPTVRRAPTATAAAVTPLAWVPLTLAEDRAHVSVCRVRGGQVIIGAAIGRHEGEGSAKDVVAELRFFDAGGKRLNDTVAGLAKSPRYLHCTYLACAPAATAAVQHRIFGAPAEAVRVELHLHRNVSEHDLLLMQRPLLAPFDAECVARLLDAAVPATNWLPAALQLAQREGDLTLLARLLAAGVAAQGSSPDLLQRWRTLQGELEETSAGWYPRLPGRVSGAAGTSDGAGAALRICHLHKTAYPFENSGGSIRCLNTVKSQLALGLDPYVFTPPGYPASVGVEGAAIHERVEGVDHYRVGAGCAGIKVLLPIERTRFAAVQSALLLRRRGVSLIHAASGVRGYELALQAFALRDLFDVPVIYEVRSFHEHTWSPMDPNILDRERTQRRITKENECMAMADHVVTISESMRKVLMERGVPSANIDVVPNAIDVASFEGAGEPVVLPALAGAGLVVGYVSNMSAREGHRHLLEALALLRASGLDARCLLVGDGPEREALEKLAATLGVSDVTVFAGEVDHHQINAYYRAIDVFVVPRVPDYAADWVTPLKPYEAMALGRPLVVTDLPALREVVGDGERGRIARPCDSASLCQEILVLANAPELAADMAAQARRWVFEHRTWEANAGRYRDIYQRVIARHRGRAEVLRGH